MPGSRCESDTPLRASVATSREINLAFPTTLCFAVCDQQPHPCPSGRDIVPRDAVPRETVPRDAAPRYTHAERPCRANRAEAHAALTPLPPPLHEYVKAVGGALQVQAAAALPCAPDCCVLTGPLAGLLLYPGVYDTPRILVSVV